MAKGEIKSLTGLRGVAALFVVVYHALRSSSPAAEFILGKGYLSVDVFFILSGYVLAMTHGDRFATGFVLADYRKFMGLRFARIYPLYIVLTLVATALAVTKLMPLYFVDSLKLALPWNAVLLQSLSLGAGTIDSPAWSLSTEWVAYLVFPLLSLVILGGAVRRAWWAVAAALLGLAIVCIYNGVLWGGFGDGPLGVFESKTLYPVLRCLAGFGLGMAVYRLSSEPVAEKFAARPIYADLLGLGLIALLFVRPADLLFVALAALLIAHLGLSSRSLVSRALSAPAVHYFGLISYSIYLVHWPILLSLRTVVAHFGGPAILANLLGIVATLLVAPLTYRYIEVLGRDRVRQLLSQRPRPAAVAKETP